MILTNFVDVLATWFYLGRSPKAPGTMGTLGALPLAWLMMVLLPSEVYLLVVLGFVVLGVFVCQAYEQKYHRHDPSEIVIDEVAGYLISMAWLPLSWLSFLLAFLLFRFFDILKPFPVGWADKRLNGGLGVMADDILAGIMSNLVLQGLFFSQWGHSLLQNIGFYKSVF